MKLSLSPEQALRYYESRLGELHRNGRQFMALCPMHSDRNPSLAIDAEKGWQCHACKIGGGPIELERRLHPDLSVAQAARAVTGAAGAPPPTLDFSGGELAATYTYRGEHGEYLFEARRYDLPESKKRFTLGHKDKDGRYTSGMAGVRLVPYNLPEVIVARQVLVVEGEKCCDALSLALKASCAGSEVAVTTNHAGAGKWQPEYARYFGGKDVIVIPDNDEPGFAHADKVAASLAGTAREVRISPPLGDAPKYDVADFLVEGGTVAALKEILKRSAAHQPAADTRLLVPAPAFCSSGPEHIDWLVDGLIQRGANGVIAADPKGAKSFCAADLAIATATGTQWLGMRCAQGPVAVISREDNPALTAWRVRHLSRGRGVMVPDGIWINSRAQSPTFHLDVLDEMEPMRAAIVALNPVLIILDVLNVLHSQDENDQNDVRGVLDAALRLSPGNQCSIAIVHHFRKWQQGDSGLTQRLRGSSAIAGWFEWLVALSTDHREGIRTAEFEIKAAPPPESIQFRIESDDQSCSLNLLSKEVPATEGKKKYRRDDDAN